MIIISEHSYPNMDVSRMIFFPSGFLYYEKKHRKSNGKKHQLKETMLLFLSLSRIHSLVWWCPSFTNMLMGARTKTAPSAQAFINDNYKNNVTHTQCRKCGGGDNSNAIQPKLDFPWRTKNRTAKKKTKNLEKPVLKRFIFMDWWTIDRINFECWLLFYTECAHFVFRCWLFVSSWLFCVPDST